MSRRVPRPGREKDFGCCGLGAIFTDLSVSVIAGARIGRGGEWECQALVIVPVGAEGQEAGWLCKVAGLSCDLGMSFTRRALVPWV